MYYKFDRWGKIERPQLILCEISRDRIGEIDTIQLSMDLKYNNISEVHFTVSSINKMNMNGETTPNELFDEVIELRMIYIPYFGWFQLRDIVEKYDNYILQKECIAYSAECMFQNKQVVNLEGEFVLYNPLDTSKSLMHLLFSRVPGWSLGNVDGVFLTRQRTMDVSSKDLYSLMTTDLAEAYECIFVFDYDNYRVDIVDATRTFRPTSIYLSYHNLIKSSTVKPLVENIITAMAVYGGGDLSIAGVNPNGSDTIYNVDYFKDRMSDGLQRALAAYEARYASLQSTYANYLLQYKNENINLATLNNNAPQYTVDFDSSRDGTCRITPSLTSTSGLGQLEALYDALQGVRGARIEKGNIPYTDVNSIIRQVESAIENKERDITNSENRLESLMTQLQGITNQLKMENNFTNDQWVELNQYFIFDTLQDNTFIWTDIMTEEQKQNVQQELYEFGQRALNRAAYPRYTFEIDSVNFVALPEFDYFTEQFELGTTFTLDLEKYTVKPILLGVHINFEDLTDFKLMYGNKTKLDDSFSWMDFNGGNVNASNTISFDLIKIEAMAKNNDIVTEFINGSLIAAVNSIKSTEEYTDVTIDENGIRLREYDTDTHQLKPYEAWMRGSQLVFSDNNFNSAKLALGRITSPTGGTVYGLCTERLICKSMTRSELMIGD